MESTVIGVFESQTQIDLLKDSLSNDGISTESLSVIGKRVKMESATSSPAAQSQAYQQIISTGGFSSDGLGDMRQIADQLTNFGVDADTSSFYATKAQQGSLVAALKVDKSKSRVASGRFRNANAKYVKIY